MGYERYLAMQKLSLRTFRCTYMRRVKPMLLRTWIYRDDFEQILANDHKYLGSGDLTLKWELDRGVDDYLHMCNKVLMSTKFSNVASLDFRCEHLLLDSRFLRPINKFRSNIRKLSITCWTYIDVVKDNDSLDNLEQLESVEINISDGNVAKNALNQFVTKLPRVKYLSLINRGCDRTIVSAGNLPKHDDLRLHNVELENEWFVGTQSVRYF